MKPSLGAQPTLGSDTFGFPRRAQPGVGASCAASVDSQQALSFISQQKYKEEEEEEDEEKREEEVET